MTRKRQHCISISDDAFARFCLIAGMDQFAYKGLSDFVEHSIDQKHQELTREPQSLFALNPIKEQY